MSDTLPRWRIDAVHSTIDYEVSHMGFSVYRGKFKGVEGNVVLDPANLGKDFLQSDQHPHLIFKSTAVETHSNGATLNGELTIRGVTRPVSLRVSPLGQGKNPFAQKQMLAFRAEGELDRGDYGIVWNVPLDNGGKYLGEKVRLVLNVELLQLP